MSSTAKSWVIKDAPKYLKLFGDKVKKVESAQHIIEFPGGAIEVSRCTDGSYWAHIIVNRRQFAEGDGGGLTSARGEVVGSRIEHANGHGVADLSNEEHIEHVAVLIKPRSKP